MKVTIKISTDNAAFEDSGAGVELARILRQLADKVEEWSGVNEFAISAMDLNGNKVGQLVARD